MKNTDRETMKKLATENGLTADHFFKSPQGFVISHGKALNAFSNIVAFVSVMKWYT